MQWAAANVKPADSRAELRHAVEEEAEAYREKIRPWVDRDLGAAVGVIEVELPADRMIWLHPAH